MADNGKLEYLNIRQNKIDKIEEIRKLTIFSQLTTLVISNNLVIDRLGETWIYQVLGSFKGLKRLNKVEISMPLLEKLFYYQKEKWEIELEKEQEKERKLNSQKEGDVADE